MALFTKLDAVNQMLDEGLGEDPVDSLDSGLPDAEAAERTLDRVSQRVQAKGWYVNRDEELAHTFDTDGFMLIGAAVMRVDSAGSDCNRNVVVRVHPDDSSKRVLFDLDNKTFTFTKTIKLDVISELDFADLTPELQFYITAKATRLFQQRDLGSGVLDQFTGVTEVDAWASLMDAEAEAEDSNILRDSRSVNFPTRRNNRNL